MIADAIKKLADRKDLTRDEVRRVFSEMMDGAASEVQKAAFLVALRMKGETVDEIAGAATAMRERVVPLDVDPTGLIDTCGTGGDGRSTFNISTVSAIVAAGAGAVVAKHGNRAVSSSCGSADVLAALGVRIELNPEEMVAVLKKVGISFLFAPRLHPATGSVVGVRRELGLRTIFNVLGPLTNPARARRQVIGVYSSHLVDLIARVLVSLGAEHALVVHSHDGMDEISVSAPSRVSEVKDGEISSYEIESSDLGLGTYSIDDLRGGDARRNAEITRAILEGESGAPRDVVVANAGAAIYVAGLAGSIRDGAVIAQRTIDSGAAARKLAELVAETNGAGVV
ncbi:MAG TPA: anthranilate phosphoribosyltransferase [Thermoanaerobaculia bacterium]|nr:anthranilate phosphoribosyltransferase [Thermoanaerobaculia bacterium]